MRNQHKKKDHPIAAGSPIAPKQKEKTETSAPNSILPQRHPFVKWLESLKPGAMFATAGKLFTVASVEPISRGRMITLCKATSLAPRLVIDRRSQSCQK